MLRIYDQPEASKRSSLIKFVCLFMMVFISAPAFADDPTVDFPTGDQNFDQGVDPNLDVGAAFGDIDGDTLTYSATGLPASLTVDTDSGIMSGILTNDDVLAGPGYSVVITADDGVGSVDDSFTLTVDNVNDAPTVIAPTGDQNYDQDTDPNLDTSLAFEDIDGDTLTYSATGLPASLTLDTDSGLLTGTLTNDDVIAGPDFSIVITADEGNGNGNGNGESVDDAFTLTVNDVNDAPTVIAATGDQNFDQDTDPNLDVSLAFEDIDGDTLTYSATGLPDSLTLDTDSGLLTGTLTNDDVIAGPDFSVVITADDGNGDSVDDAFTLTVNDVNEIPLAIDQTLSTDEDTDLAITLTGTDPEDDVLTFAVVVEPVSGAVVCTDADCTYTPDLDFNGDDSFTFTADDGEITSVEATITITVDAINDAPIADDQTLSIGEDTDLAITLTATDVEDDALTFAVVVQPVSGAVVCTGADCTYTPNEDFTGDDSFTFTADDGEPSAEATITITVDEVDDAPVIEDQLALSTDEEVALTITLDDLTITDIDSDADTFVLTVQDGTDYTRVDNTITPDLDFTGDLTVPVTVSDGNSDSEVFNVLVTVVAINDAPVIVGQVDLSTPEDASLTVLIDDIIVTDPDNVFPDDFSLLLLDGANYTLAGNTISPDANFNGTLSVLATVSDGLISSAAFALTVEVTSENDDPVLETPIDVQDALENKSYSLDISGNFSDADGDTLSFTATGLPESGNLTFDEQTGVFSGTPRDEDTRDTDPYIVIVTATDSQPDTVPAQTQFDLNISALARANVSLDISVAPDPAMLNDELNWTLTASSVGPQSVSNIELTGSFVGSGLNISSTSSCTIQAAVGQVSDFSCTLGTLPVGGSASAVFTTMTSDPGDVVVYGLAETTDDLPLDPNTDDNSNQAAVGVAESFSNGVLQVLGSSEVRSVAAGDVDGDGIADLVVGTAAGQPIQIFLGDGFRGFLTSAISLPDNAMNEGIALADFDGNGTLDLVTANGGGQEDAVYSNDGDGNFTQVALLGLSFGQDIAVGDFDEDGNLDIAIAAIQGNPVYFGDGTGVFDPNSLLLLGNANSQAVVVADLNGDGRDDIVFANTGSDSQVWIKNSGLGFSLGDALAIGDAAAVTVGQFGGNMRPDLAFGRTSSGAGDLAANPVLINDGSGSFSDPFVTLGTSPTNDILSGDVNNDGQTDLVFINASGVHQIWTATGSGFRLHSEQIVDFESTAGVLTELGMSDEDEPGGVDLAMGGAVSAGAGLFLNDSFGNLGHGDAVPPELTLTGENSIDVPSGSNYIDERATAVDNIDGDITTSIVVSNPVNTALVGNYTVRYDVVDLAGNRASQITRSVTVTPAAGTGGGGGGSTSPLLLILLIFVAFLIAHNAKSAIIQASARN
jgi:hypothetical protein